MSQFKLPWMLGSRFFRARQRSGLVSFISASSTIGIALGVMVLIIGLSVMNGFERELRNRLLSVLPHGELEAVHGGLNNWPDMVDQVREHPNVRGAAPFIRINGLLSYRDNMKATQLRAVDPVLEGQVTSLSQYMKTGEWQALSQSDSLILGEGLAQQLGVKTGDTLSLLVSDDDQGFRAPRRVRLKLVGLIHIGGQLDQQLALTSIQTGQQILGLGDEVQGIGVRYDKVFEATELTREVGRSLNQYLYLKSWMFSQGYLYQDIQMVRTLMYVIMLLVVAVASFNIVTTLVMSVQEKRGDIAILLTMGARARTLLLTFMVQGSISAFFGILAGVVLGCLGAYYMADIYRWFVTQTGTSLLNGDIYFIDFLPSELQWPDVIMVSGIALLICIIATLYPAWQASRLQPARHVGQV